MSWSSHFEMHDRHTVGMTACGRDRAKLLDMKNEFRLQHRRWLID
jgi:hypothetical protein